MIQTPVEPEDVRRYLLGEATEDEAGEIETSFFGSVEVAEAMGAAENDLIEDYLENRLDAGRRARFETHYLASLVHRRRLAVTRALRDRPQSRRRRMTVPRLILMAAAAALFITVLGTWLARPGVDPGRLVAISLPAVLARGGTDTPTLRIGSGATDVELRLEQGGWEAAPPLHVTVNMLEGGEAWRGTATASSGRTVLVGIPADRLPSGDYVVVLFSGSGSGSGRELQRYFVRVVRP